MKLITETISDYTVITESVNGKKRYYLQGIFCQAGVKNRNGRIYPLNILENAIDVYVKTMVQENRAIGELGHPDTPEISYDRAAIKIESLTREGNNFIGKALVLDTEKGMTVQKLLEANVKIGVSSRALGTTRKENGISVVTDDLIIRAIDVVSDPSAPQAFPAGIMEGVEWGIEDGTFIEHITEDALIIQMTSLMESLLKRKRP